MKQRYYVQQGINQWMVLDRLKVKMHNDKVAVFQGRQAARNKAKELNDEERRDRVADHQLPADGELI